MIDKNQNNKESLPRKKTLWGVLKWVLYILATVSIIAATFIVAILHK